MRRKIKDWWWSVTFDGWPYELPENKKWWVPTFVNEWLGNRTWNESALNRPYCWIKGHDPYREGRSIWYCIRCFKPLRDYNPQGGAA